MKIINNYSVNLIPTDRQDKTISVCIVIYNIAEYLDRAIQSAINQTYKNLEILLIDDGSTDGCDQICDKYAALDSRVRVIHKPNGGVSSARNAAILNATGEYFTFLDGDDYIEPNMYETMLSALWKEDVDMVVCRYRQVDKEGVISDGSTEDAYIFEGYELLETFLREDEKYTIQNAPWNKLYKRSLIGELRFPDGIYEDALYTPMLLAKVNKSVYIDWALYNYVRDRQTSIMHKAVVNSHIFSELIPNYYKRSQFIKETGRDDLYRLADYFLYKRLLIFITEVNRSNDPKKKEYLQILDKHIREDAYKFPEVYSCKYANPNEYKKMKIYLKSKLLYRIFVCVNEAVIIPLKQRIRK